MWKGLKILLLNKSLVYNLLANYGTTISGSLLSLLFTPLYIHYLSIEAYGIIGFIASLMVFLNFLDLGMGQTVNREMAKYHKDAGKVNYVNNLVFSLQSVYIAIGIFCALLIIIAAPTLATKWFNAEQISTHTITYAFVILGITIACRWPYAFFSSALRGMQFQVLLNTNEIFWNILKSVGSLMVLIYFSGTLITFLWYQCVVILLQTLSSIFLCWRFIEKPSQPKRFDLSILKSLSGYIASMGVASIMVALIFQLDKIILSKTLKGVEYGYYVLSNNLSTTLFIVSTPVAIALFPHFTGFLHRQQTEELQNEFHKYTKILSATLLPIFIMLCFFTPELLWIWTKNQAIIDHTTLLVRIMLIGTVMDAYMVVPNTLLLSASKTRFILFSHTVALFVMVPLTYFLSTRFGATGGAISVAFILGGYFVFEAPFVFKFCLPGHYFKWLWGDILKIAIPLIAVAACIRMVLPVQYLQNRLWSFLLLGTIGLTLLLFAIQLSGLTFFDKFLFWKRRRPVNN
jgi:O-antigen/teichoic acid export membrane protein